MKKEIIQSILNPLVLFGFLAQFVFFLRFVVQWWASEKAKKSIIPLSFWYLSIAGSIMILIYSLARRDIVFAVASVLNTLIYARNIVLQRSNSPKNDKKVAF